MEFGFADLLQAIPGIMNSFRGIDTSAQSNIAGQQQNIANAIYNPSNPLYQQLYGQQRREINQNTASTIAQAGNQNRLLSAMGRTPLFSPERNGEQSFRQAVMGQQGSDLAAQNQARGILQQGMTALGNPGGLLGGGTGAFGGANSLNEARYGQAKTLSGANNQNQVGFDSLAKLLRGY